MLFSVILFLFIASCAFANAVGNTPGGWTPVPVDDDKIQTNAAFAIRTKYPGIGNIDFVVLGASKQVVAGMNYNIEVRVTIPGESKCSVDRFTIWDRFGTLQLTDFESTPCEK